MHFACIVRWIKQYTLDNSQQGLPSPTAQLCNKQTLCVLFKKYYATGCKRQSSSPVPSAPLKPPSSYWFPYHPSNGISPATSVRVYLPINQYSSVDEEVLQLRWNWQLLYVSFSCKETQIGSCGNRLFKFEALSNLCFHWISVQRWILDSWIAVLCDSPSSTLDNSQSFRNAHQSHPPFVNRSYEFLFVSYLIRFILGNIL